LFFLACPNSSEENLICGNHIRPIFPIFCKWSTHQSSQRSSNYVWQVRSKEIHLEASTLLGSGVMVFCLLASSGPLCLGSTLNILMGGFHRLKPISAHGSRLADVYLSQSDHKIEPPAT
jgi:hypothetical protein